MKKVLHLIAFVFVAGTLAAQSIPNGGFENWTSHIWMDPTGSFASNDQYVPYGWASNVTRVKPGYHGLYAVSLMTTKVGADTTQAYFANGNPTQNPASGGIPYSQKPTGIRFYYQSSIMPGDTSVVLALFKKSGVDIGIYEFKITGNAGTYTLYTKNFVPALPGNPDTVVFGAVASLGILKNKNGIPGTTFIIDSVSFTGGVTQPAAMNGDFENWTADTATYPTGWSGGYPGVIQTTDKYAGTYALELVTSTNVNNGPQPGFATTGIVSPNNNNGNAGGYPFTNQVDTLSFYYKYAPVGNDTASIQLEFKKGGSFIGGAGISIFVPQANYTFAKLPFNVGSVPDTVIVSIQSTQNYGNITKHIGSVLKVDNMMLASQPLAVNNLAAPGSIKVYPNPTNGLVYLDMKGVAGSVQSIEVYDMSGRMMSSTTYPSMRNNVNAIDMSKYASGVYMLHINTTEGSYYQKISRE